MDMLSATFCQLLMLYKGIFGQNSKSYQDIIDACKCTLAQLQTSYLDLYLIHHPGAKAERLDQWRALVELQSQGLVKHIGVSNYSVKHLEEIKVRDILHFTYLWNCRSIFICQAAGLPAPEANQIEVHPLCTQTDLITYMRTHGITPIAYSSLAPASTWRVQEGHASGKTPAHTTHAATIAAMMEKYAVSEAQLLLKWAVQLNLPIIPKSSKAVRIEENAQLFHFSIDEGDMRTLCGLDQDLALAWPGTNPLEWD